MFLNTSTGGDLRRIVVRLCACLLISGLFGQTLIVGPIPRAKANVAQLPVPVSAPPMPFEVGSGSVFSQLPEMSSIFASLVAFASLNSTESKERESGFENAILQPLRNLEPSTLNSLLAPAPPAGEIKYDFDGDGKADIGRWRGVATEFKVKNSNGGAYSTYTLGSSGAVAAPGDFNGNGITDAAVFSSGTWTYKTSPTATAQTITFGTAGDIPYAGDYDGDGTTDAAIFRPSTNTWWIRQSSDSSTVSYAWGAAGDIPITGNWDGDLKTDIAVYRPSNGTWYIQKSSGGQLYLAWGLSYDVPVQGDFDADGKSDVTVFRPTTGTWYILTSSSNWTAYSTANWGVWSDQPTPADYNGDGTTDLAVWRPTDGNWYISYGSTYEVHTLGISGDTAVPSAYTKQVGGTASGDVINAERVKPRNTTGGTNLYSQNFGWGTSLVGLSGRAGLDAGFGIGYNSLVWLKVGNAMYFDPDRGNMAPGFRMGFPVIEPAYYNATRQKWAYMMVTPSGSRVEFIETAASNVYETADSSYTQLTVSGASNPFDPVENLSIKVTTTDGTQMTYTWAVNSYKCTQIKDRNGNYITLAYDSLARLAGLTDTLGRVVTVNYGSNGLPSTITQTWKDNNGAGANVTHTWATFAYTTKAVDTDFAASLTVVGPPDGTVFTVLDKITYPDSSSTKFEYNDYLQVKKVSSIAADSASHVLNYVSTNLTSPSAAQTDCPRFTETRSWVENFNQDTNGTAQEVVIPNSFTANQQYSLPTGGTATGNLVQVTSPDGTVEKTFTGNTGWREGLPIATETWANINSTLTKKRWTWTDYTQDDVNLSYIKNPRVIESKIGDTENSFVRRTTVDYWTSYGLTKEVKVYDTDQTTVLKKSYTEYNLDTAYTSRRIIGLPSLSESYGKNDQTGTLEFVSKVTYAYDEGDFSDASLNQNISPTQHDTSYSASFITGRANLTSTTRHDVTGQTAAVTQSVKYNTAGAPVAQISPWDGTQVRTTKIDYTDNFNTTGNPATFAYPTKLYDSAGNFSQVKYRYDIGANVWATSPAPAGNSTGKTTTREFDSIGRASKETITNTGAYTRYEYPTNGVQSKVFSTIVDTNNNNTGDTADEVMSESWSDGAGRVRRSRTEHPGSSGGWSGSIVEYDILGQVKRSSVPTEISVPNANNPDTWAPAGDDYTRGWLWTYQKYDWKGRVVRKINTDGADSTNLNNSDILIAYEGCGCAGGQITTVSGEEIIEKNWQGQPVQTLGRRTKKIYTDILGRTNKVEILNWDNSVYSSVLTFFDGADRPTTVHQYEGVGVLSNPHQTTSFFYDGFGRLTTEHIPQQDNDKYTSYTYFADNKIKTRTDARGATTHNVYSSLGLLENINYSVPTNSNIPIPSQINFTYDNVGNRTSMIDGTGTTTYQYNSLSQLSSETKIFSAMTGSSFALSYEYSFAGKLSKIHNADGTITNYEFDKIGRLENVVGEGFFHQNTTVSQIIEDIRYRAFGAIKSASYQNGRQLQISYNNRLLPEEYKIPTKMEKSYSYQADGKIEKSQDLIDYRNDRRFTYDQVGRVKKAYSGIWAREGVGWPGSNQNQFDYLVPFRKEYGHNVWDNPTMSLRGADNYAPIQNRTFQNNRLTGWHWAHNPSQQMPAWGYDSDGRFVADISINGGGTTVKYDAAGLAYEYKTFGGDYNIKTAYYDGDAKVSAENMTVGLLQWDANGNPILDPAGGQAISEFGYTKYCLTSSALGGAVVGEIFQNSTPNQNAGTIVTSYVYADGAKIATYLPNNLNRGITWTHTDSLGFSNYYTSFSAETPINDPSCVVGNCNQIEIDPEGNELGRIFETGGSGGGPSHGESGGGYDNFTCELDGVLISCGQLADLDYAGAVDVQQMNDSVANWDNSSQEHNGLDGMDSPIENQNKSRDTFATYVKRLGSKGTIPKAIRDDSKRKTGSCPKGTVPTTDADGNTVCVGVGEYEVTVKDEGPDTPIEFVSMIRDRANEPSPTPKPEEKSKGPSEADLKCAKILAALFGGKDAVANAGDYDPATLKRASKAINDGFLFPQGVDAGFRGKNSPHGPGPRNDITTPPGNTDRGGIIHVYPNADGHLNKDDNVGVYIPNDFKRIAGNSGKNNTQYFQNGAGIVMAVSHVNTRGVRFGSSTNSAGSNLLGYFVTEGGKYGGSSDGYYVHTHISFFSKFNGNLAGGTRTDPRSIFCKDLGF